MANLDNPRGFHPFRHLTGGRIETREMTVTTGATIYQGDLVTMTSAGTISASAADDGTVVCGVAAEYIASAAAGDTIAVYADPYITFRVQMDDVGTASTAADIGQVANHLAGAGSSTTKLSGHELDMSDIGTGSQLKILGLVAEVGNTWGANCDVEVLINEQFFKAAVAGV